MGINKDYDFEACETCPPLYEFAARCSCKIEDVLVDISKELNEGISLWEDSE